MTTQGRFSNANDPRAVRSRQSLHRALLQLLESRALEQITIRDIAAKARVGYTTYFRHYPTKEALFEAVVEELTTHLFSLSLPAMDSRNLRDGATALFSYVHENRQLWKTLLTGGAAGTMRAEFLRHARKAAKSRSKPGTDDWRPTDLIVIVGVTGTIETLAWWLQAAKPLPVERVIDIYLGVVMSPIVTAGHALARSPRRKTSQTSINRLTRA